VQEFVVAGERDGRVGRAIPHEQVQLGRTGSDREVGTTTMARRLDAVGTDRQVSAWPTTEGLGMTDRTRELLQTMAQRRSPLAAPSEAR
jgi:hypothetical protein